MEKSKEHLLPMNRSGSYAAILILKQASTPDLLGIILAEQRVGRPNCYIRITTPSTGDVTKKAAESFRMTHRPAEQ